MIAFKYKKEKVGILGEATPRPVAIVNIKTSDGKWYRFQPYIDSGADITLLSQSTGKLIGLKEDGPDQKKSTLGGISGGIPVIYTTVTMSIDNHEFTAKVAWAQVPGVPPLLGRADVFEHFKITFKEKDGVIEFEKV